MISSLKELQMGNSPTKLQHGRSPLKEEEPTIGWHLKQKEKVRTVLSRPTNKIPNNTS